MNLRPDSLWSRLTLLFLGVLLFAQLLSAALHFRDRGEVLKHASGFNSAIRIAGMVQLLDPLSAEQRKAVVDALDLPPLRLRVGKILPNRSFQSRMKVPADWVCPVCGADKSQFEKA